MDSRSCDATRMLWCPDNICVCIGDFSWNTATENCTCAANQLWNGIACQTYGYYGDPCNGIPCQQNLTCQTVINQTYTTGQDVCVCDNTTYLYTNGGPDQGQCVERLSYNESCKTNFDCKDWLGLSCMASSPSKIEIFLAGFY
jgi:hypothetical protein